MTDLGVEPGPEIPMTSEPLPRGPVVGASGRLDRAYFNWFEARDRKLGEIVSGVNLNRQTIVSLVTATETELTTLTASVESVAEVATDAENAVATLTTEVEAARQGEANLSAKVTALSTATATVDGKLSASYALTVDAGGRIASMKLLSNGSTSDVAFTATTFRIFNGVSNEAIFSVSGGAVTIDGDLILTGTLTRNRLASGEIPAIAAEGLISNYYEQSTDPGAVTNGSLWFKTSTSELFLRRSGSWGLIANIVTVSAFTSLTLSDADVFGSTTGAASYTKTVTATPVGGSGFTYSWRRLFNEGTGEITPDSTTSSAPLFTLGIGLTSKALFICTATETSSSTSHSAFVYFDITTI